MKVWFYKKNLGAHISSVIKHRCDAFRSSLVLLLFLAHILSAKKMWSYYTEAMLVVAQMFILLSGSS